MNSVRERDQPSFARSGSILAYDALWQTPAITEKHAYVRLLEEKFNSPAVTYFAFPWASLIDGTNRAASLGTELRTALASADHLPRESRTISVCQHIKFRDFIAEFKRAGITDLFVSHAKKGEYVIDGIRIHPFPLYPVQLPAHEIWQPSNDAQADLFLSRKYLYSFVGAFDRRWYQTLAREWIFQLPPNPRGLIKNRNAWHYDHRVYQEQVLRKHVPEARLIEERRNALEFKQILRETQFSLCPSGSGPNSIRLWESIEFGAIPVILADDLQLPESERLWEEACVIVEESEDSIRELPAMLERLSKDRERIAAKLDALLTLKQRYGHQGFVHDILRFSEQVPPVPTKTPPTTSCERRFYLSINAVDDEVASSWVAWINDICESLGLRATICLDRELANRLTEPDTGRSVSQTIAGDGAFPLTHDWAEEDLLTVADSRVLSRTLLERFNRIAIRTKEKPTRIHGSLYDPLAIAQKHKAKTLITPQVEPLDFHQVWQPKCSLLTSMFNGDEYVQGFLQNSQSLDGYSDIEHFIVRPASPGHEHVAVCKHLDANPNAVYIWLHNDPGLYEVWNQCSRLAGAPYLSNANIDDRRAPGHVAQLTKVLDENPDIHVASAALRVTTTKNLSWEESENCEVWYANEPSEKYTAQRLFKQRDGQLIAYNAPHCMPVWRRSVHIWNGWFDERRFGPSADWEFWLRAGKKGAKFYILSQPLGLYLRAESSYWRRSGSATDFDQRIVALHADAVDPKKQNRLDPPFSPRVQSLLESRRRRDSLSYLTGLTELAADVGNDARDFPALKRLIDMIAQRDLGQSGEWLIDWRKETVNLLGLGADREGIVLRLILDALHEAGAAEEFGTVQLERATQALDQLVDLTGAPEAMLGRAFVAHLEQDVAVEQYYLARAHSANDPEFWPKLQAAYQFTRPLAELCDDIGGLPAFTQFEEVRRGQRLFFFPDYTHGNPYQKLLYAGLESRGVRIKGINELAVLLDGQKKYSPQDVLHIHWFNILYKGVEPARYQEVLETFLEQVDQLKAGGMRIFWTVHNRYSHDLDDVSIELGFQQRLCERADMVLIHHPCLLAELTEWLPNNAPIRFLEHGNYIGAYPNEITRNQARKALDLHTDDLVIGVIGQVRSYKGLSELLPILRQVMSDNSRCKLVVAGKISCEETRKALALLPTPQVLVRDSFIDDSEFQNYLNAADFVLLSYRAILTSGSLFQAFSFHIPVIAPALGSLPSYVIHGWNGFIYNNHGELSSLLHFIAQVRGKKLETMRVAVKSSAQSFQWPLPGVGGQVDTKPRLETMQ